MSLPAAMGLGCLLPGCSQTPVAEFRPPSISSSSAASRALEAYDTNGDGALDDAELEASPALASVKAKYDTNGDGKISKDELVARFDTLFSRGAVLTNLSGTVVNGRSPVAGATVRFVPEEFLGDGIYPAVGETDVGGRIMPSLEGDDLPADVQESPFIQVGLYRVEVSAGGSTFTLGHEVDPTDRQGITPTFDLQSAGS